MNPNPPGCRYDVLPPVARLNGCPAAAPRDLYRQIMFELYIEVMVFRDVYMRYSNTMVCGGVESAEIPLILLAPALYAMPEPWSSP